MTKKQKLELEQSEKRQRINEILNKNEKTEQDHNELSDLTKQMQGIEVEYRAAVYAEEGEQVERETRAAHSDLDAEARERLELRSRASLTNYIQRYMGGKLPQGAELELQEIAKVNAIPMELWDVEQRADTVTGTPSSVGVNLDNIRPMVFSKSVAPMLGIEMPRVESGTYASATISTPLTAGTKVKSGVQEATAADFTVQTATPKRISARLSMTLEDVAAVGAGNFESVLRENLSLVLSDALDDQVLNGDGQAPNLTGIFQRLTDPAAPAAGVVNWVGFAKQVASGVDGLWANSIKDVCIVVNPETYRLAASTFQGSDAEMSAAAYAEKYSGMFWTNKRMPDTASNVAQALLYRKGRMGMRTAVCPHWGEVGIDDVYTGANKAERYVTFHVLIGATILVQPNAYKQVAYRVST